MTSQGDHSVAYYDLERQLVRALHRLGTANADGIAALHTAARDITERLERIAALRVEYAGTHQPVVEFENRALTMENSLEAERRTKLGSAHSRQSVGAEWSVFESAVSGAMNETEIIDEQPEQVAQVEEQPGSSRREPLGAESAQGGSRWTTLAMSHPVHRNVRRFVSRPTPHGWSTRRSSVPGSVSGRSRSAMAE